LNATDRWRVVQRIIWLGDLAANLNPLSLRVRIAEAFDMVAEPPPGDPARLRGLAAAFDRAAVACGPLADQIEELTGTAPPEAWDGVAAGAPAQVLVATADLVAAVRPTFRTTADAIRVYAGAVDDLRDRHEALRRQLRDVWLSIPRLTLLGFEVKVPNLAQLQRLAAAAQAVLEGCQQVYRDSLDAADELSRTLGDITARARAQQGWRAGLPAATAVLVADTAILSAAQSRRAAERRSALAPADRARLDALLAGAPSADKRAYLLKAYAAGHSIGEVAAFDAQIHDLSPVVLREAVGIRETANPMMVALASADPIFALSVTAGGALAEAAQRIDGATVLDATAWMNGHADVFGTRYAWYLVDDSNPRRVRRALRDAVSAADRGHPVLVLVGDDHPTHFVLILGRRTVDLLIYEPARGAVTRASVRDFLDGAMTDATVYGLVTPSDR
jgi:hypothetical protein